MIYLLGNVRHQIDFITMIINSHLFYFPKLSLVIFKNIFQTRLVKKAHYVGGKMPQGVYE